ncbi:MAG: hypothetical protein LAP87_12435 [Acidobacteriia bacterium]|nr:hypothetical protein [Terriglobia bacterium]
MEPPEGMSGQFVAEVERLIESARVGRLAERGRAEQFTGTERRLVEGINSMLDAVVRPLNAAADCVDKISKGTIPAKITEQYNGDCNAIKNSLNTCIDVLGRLLSASEEMYRAQKAGDIDAFIATDEFQGVYRQMAKDVNEAARLHINNILKFLEIVGCYAEGDFSKVLDRLPGKQIVANQRMDLLRGNLTSLIAETTSLTHEAVAGRLAARADASKFAGDYRKIVEGVNETLDAILLPIAEGNRILAQISSGKVDEQIAQTYKGDHEKMKHAVNKVTVVLQRLHKEMARLTLASRDGQLSERGKPEQFQGVFAEVVKGVNDMLDAILLPIGESNRVLALIRGCNLREKVEIACKGDHERMKNAVNGVHDWLAELIAYVTKVANGDMTATMAKASDQDQIHEWLVLLKSNINALVADAVMLAKAAADGKLGTRADAAQHEGAYRQVVEGINGTLEAITEPLKVTAQNAATLAASAEELTAVSHQMAGNAEETATQANVVSAASEQVSKNVASVAASGEEMQASIREIAKSANEAARVAKNAVQVANTTNLTVSKLGESSTEIGNVIKVITSIAQQTNLLALNATIEAARAGEAGKGFAVVANEVKELAKQTAKATEEISQKIEAIQGDTKASVQAIGEIGAIINQINDISNSIASAVEEQTVTTNEINRSMAEASRGVGDITKNITGVAVAAKDTTQGANNSQQAAQELSQMASRLQTVVSRFTF